MLTKSTYTGNRLEVDRSGRREGSNLVPVSLGGGLSLLKLEVVLTLNVYKVNCLLKTAA